MNRLAWWNIAKAARRTSAVLKGRSAAAAVAILAVLATTTPANATSRIKDIADFEGIRDNQLVGYGLVVGLSGTGDSLSNAPFTRQSLISMLERMGVNTRNESGSLNTDNVAAVMVTANLPPFQAAGTRIDVTVSALGDSESLLGGTLLVTPLRGADGEVYAVSQGPIAVGGFAAQGEGQTVTQNIPTNGRITNGAIVEREIGFQLSTLDRLRISLRNPDLTTARRMADAINAQLGEGLTQALDPSTVLVRVPAEFRNDMVTLLTDIEQVRVQTDQTARVVVDEGSGIIVIGKDVRIDTVAIAQGNLTIRVTETPQVSQPLPFSATGETVTVPRTNIDVDTDDENRLVVVPTGVSLEELVNGLNALGVGPRDMISILQAIKAAGALQAELEII